jgi:hypothetical protein
MHPHYPVFEGHYQMTQDWSVILPTQFNRRFEEDSLVFWRPGFTMWVSVWGIEDNQSREERLILFQRDISPEAYDFEECHEDKRWQLSYRLKEDMEDERCPALYCFILGEQGDILMSIYFDDDADLLMAKQIRDSLTEKDTLP